MCDYSFLEDDGHVRHGDSILLLANIELALNSSGTVKLLYVD